METASPKTMLCLQSANRVVRLVICRSALLVFALFLVVPSRALTIVATFDSTITGTPGAVDTINQAIQVYESTFSTPITVSIAFDHMGSGLGQSTKAIYETSYSGFLAQLQNHATSANDTTALAHLPSGINNPVTGTSNIYLTGANALALGFTGTIDSSGTIGLNLNLINSTRSSINPGKYDLLAIAEHEIDEILGLGSLVGNSLNLTSPMPEDLFRYDSSGARTYTTVGDNAYFSINGSTLLARFNQNAGPYFGGDYGDWWSPGSQTPDVQDAFGTPGMTPNLSSAEFTALDVIGYTLTGVPEPSTTAVLIAGAAGLGAVIGKRVRRSRRPAADRTKA